MIFRKAQEARLQANRVEADQTVSAIRTRCLSLYGFLQEAWHVLEPETPFIGGWVVETLCEALEAVSNGAIKRLLINIPPGFAKSLIVSVFWPAWEWTFRPSCRYLTASYREELAIRDNTRMRTLVQSEWYQEHWGATVSLASDQNEKRKFANTATGNRECVAFISMTGGRGNRVIIDDPHSVKTAESEQQRKETIKVFLESVPHRLNNAKEDAIIVIMQRLHEEDVSGVILSHGLGYVHLCLPMEFEPARRCSVPEINFTDPRTYDGELLHPERMARAEVDLLKKSLGGYGTSSQLQQNPTSREGNLFPVGMLEIKDYLPANITKACRAWDFAATRQTIGTDPDWTAGVLVVRDEARNLWVVDVQRKRDKPNVIKQLVKATASRDGMNCRVRLPKDPGQAGVAQADDYARLLQGYPLRILPVTGEKVTRATPAASQVEAGTIFLVKAPWNDDFIEELRSFPNGSHDDQVDAFADAVNEISGVSTNEGLFEFFREEAARLERQANGEKAAVDEGEWVRLIPPGSIGSAYGRDGTAYAKGSDGVMKVHPEDAPALLGQKGWSKAPDPVGGSVTNG